MTIYTAIRSILFSLLLLAGVRGTAQSVIDEDFLEKIEINAKPLWDESIPAFAVKEAPAQYNNESAVVLGFRRSVNIDKKSRSGFLTKGERSLIFNETVRFKIQLNDRNSVTSFTEIYFRYFDKTDGFSARVIKKDGMVLPVSLNAAVSVESASQVPEFFKSFFDQEYAGERRYYKVAVPGLEPGDILEYVTNTRSKLDVKRAGYIEFTPQYEVCAKYYPVLFNQIIIETDEKSFFKSMSVNGAPDFTKETSADPDFFKYVFTDENRGVEKDVNFINTYRVYPMTKFQVIYANNDKTKGSLVGERGVIKHSFTKEEIAKVAWEDYEQTGDDYYGNYTLNNLISVLWKEMKGLEKPNEKEIDFVKKAYLRVRNLGIFSRSDLNDKYAAFLFGSLLFQKGIKSELVISVSKNIGKMSDILFGDELRYAVKVDSVIYFACNDHSLPGEKKADLLTTEAYILYPPEKGGVPTIKPITLPDATAMENNSSYVINVQLSNSLDTLVVRRKSSFNGINKAREIGNAYRDTDYPLSDYQIYGGKSNATTNFGSYQYAFYEFFTTFSEQLKKRRSEFLKAQLEQDFKQKIKASDFSIDSKGRTPEQPELSFIENFQLGGMTRKAGKKILVNISGLVGSQLQIKKEERDRKHDINVSYARSINWEINFKIPEGYTAEGLNELGTSVDNEAGSYSCKAVQKDDVVNITIKKVYKKADMPKAQWPAMLAFVDAAFNNSFRYILLKPQN